MSITSRLLTAALVSALPAAANAALLADWTFDAHTARDSSATGTTYDLATVGTGPAYDGGYAVFDGNVSNYLQTVGPGGAANFTVSVWVRTDTANQGGFKGVFSNNNNSTAANSWQIDNNSGTYRLTSVTAAVNQNFGTPTVGVWDNLVLQKSGPDAIVHLNGVQIGTLPGNPGGLQNFRLGINRNSDQQYAMDLDRVQVWDSVENVANIYNGGNGRISGTPFNASVNNDFFEAGNWDEGLPTNTGVRNIAKVGRGLTAELNNLVPSVETTKFNRLWVGFDGTQGTFDVNTGDLRIGGGGGDGIYVGVGDGSDGRINIAQGATLRTQGAGTLLRIGDDAGGTGHVQVAGRLRNFKFFDIVNGTLEMLSTGINNDFNEGNQSFIRADGTLAYVIDGSAVGTIQRANTQGLNVNIDAAATLKITLNGPFTAGQTWTLMDYTSLSGQFAQGTSFTNEQGYDFLVDYGSGADDQLVLTYVPEPTSLALLGFGGLLVARRRRG